ncbi:MAG: hypothetical protein IPH14_08915 [Thermomonas sp.]|uniref:hypothetical protein n=1 Tax=Thermomonas sp. TaxID=1971895 RepID=UPI0025EB699F|nr:hypothetical protein [Thermomonas sp.]MBK6925365.1 hypothetical protein [Thermomonas sp.]
MDHASVDVAVGRPAGSGPAQRVRHPLLALGILWFLSAHLVASNVIGLELAFEHRNHFGLAGGVLAIGSLLAQTVRGLRLQQNVGIAIAVPLLAVLAGATLMRAWSWQDRLSLAHTVTRYAPLSARAWVQLCAGEYETGGGAVKDNPRIDAAIDACTKGTFAAPGSLNNPALLVVLKTLKGSVSQADWDLFQRRLKRCTCPWTIAVPPDPELQPQAGRRRGQASPLAGPGHHGPTMRTEALRSCIDRLLRHE